MRLEGKVMENNQEYLAHYGILGMKWGKRKAKGSSSTKKKKAKKVDPVKKMTDYELRQKINRMQMEQQYKQLSKSQVTNGKKKAQAVLRELGKVTVKAVAIAGVYGGAKYLGERYKLNEKQTLNLERAMKIADILGRN